MPNRDLCDITVVLDRSGSMAAVAGDTIGGMNRFLEDQRKAPGAARLTLVQFDNEYEPVHRAVPIAAVPPLTDATFVPRGTTALLDATGRAIAETGARLAALAEAERPGKVIFVIVTDGLENASREFTRERVMGMITHQRDAYAWQFVFLGANQDAIASAATLGIQGTHAMTYAHTGAGTAAAFAAVSRGTARARSEAAPAPAAAFFEPADREEQERHGAKPGTPPAGP